MGRERSEQMTINAIGSPSLAREEFCRRVLMPGDLRVTPIYIIVFLYTQHRLLLLCYYMYTFYMFSYARYNSALLREWEVSAEHLSRLTSTRMTTKKTPPFKSVVLLLYILYIFSFPLYSFYFFVFVFI